MTDLDDLTDLIGEKIADGEKSEALRLLKKLEKLTKSDDFVDRLFMESLVSIFDSQLWPEEESVQIWDTIFGAYKDKFDTEAVSSILTISGQNHRFDFVQSLINQGIEIDFSDEDVLFSLFMIAPRSFHPQLKPYWSADPHFAPLAVAAFFNSDPEVLRDTLQILQSEDVLDTLTQFNGDIYWGEKTYLSVSEEMTEALREELAHAQRQRISDTIDVKAPTVVRKI